MDQQYRGSVMTNLVIGAPVKPTKKGRLKLLSKMLADLEEVREAHLPQVIELGSGKPPELVFFVVIDPQTAVPGVMEKIRARLKDVLGGGETLDVRPLPLEHDLLPAIRNADCIVGWRD
jgi:hypothetical protein